MTASYAVLFHLQINQRNEEQPILKITGSTQEKTETSLYLQFSVVLMVVSSRF